MMKLMSDIIICIFALAIVVALIALFPVLVATIAVGTMVIFVMELIKSVLNNNK